MMGKEPGCWQPWIDRVIDSPGAKEVQKRLPLAGRSLGRRSRAHKRRQILRRMLRASAAVLAIWIAALVVGLAVDGIGTGGLIATILATPMAFLGLLLLPRMRAPTADHLRNTPVADLTAQTELYLEAERSRLPAPAREVVDRIGTGLDQLSPQLTSVEPGGAIERDVRKLLGEHLPGLIDSYARLPESMRSRDHAGSTPQDQLVSGLKVVAQEIDNLSEQIARGELDALATRGRYLESRYSNPGDIDGARSTD